MVFKFKKNKNEVFAFFFKKTFTSSKINPKAASEFLFRLSFSFFDKFLLMYMSYSGSFSVSQAVSEKLLESWMAI